MVDYAHLPVLELLRQIDSRVRTATEQAIETQTDLNYKVAKDLADLPPTLFEELPLAVRAELKGDGGGTVGEADAAARRARAAQRRVQCDRVHAQVLRVPPPTDNLG